MQKVKNGEVKQFGQLGSLSIQICWSIGKSRVEFSVRVDTWAPVCAIAFFLNFNVEANCIILNMANNFGKSQSTFAVVFKYNKSRFVY